MSLSISSTSSSLISEARAAWTQSAERKAASTGTRPEALPPDSVLIAMDPTLSAAVQAASSTSSSSSSPSNAYAAAASGTSAQNGRLINVLV